MSLKRSELSKECLERVRAYHRKYGKKWRKSEAYKKHLERNKRANLSPEELKRKRDYFRKAAKRWRKSAAYKKWLKKYRKRPEVRARNRARHSKWVRENYEKVREMWREYRYRPAVNKRIKERMRVYNAIRRHGKDHYKKALELRRLLNLYHDLTGELGTKRKRKRKVDVYGNEINGRKFKTNAMGYLEECKEQTNAARSSQCGSKKRS